MSCAEERADLYHGVGKELKNSDGGFAKALADKLNSVIENDKSVMAITAGMKNGTGLLSVEEKHPNNVYDVGIAEEYAVTYAAGMAKGGLKPVVCIYSTFLQRAYDNIIHDVCLQKLPVKIVIDRAGVALSDGATHHGIFDVSFLSHIPEIEIIAPSDYESLRKSIAYAYSVDTPIAVRYPNSPESEKINSHFIRSCDEIGIKLDFDPSRPPANLFVTYGSVAERVIDAKSILAERGVDVGIVLVEKIKPYDNTVNFLESILSSGSHSVYVEEGIKNGGAAMITRDLLFERGALNGVRFDIAAIDDGFANPAEKCDLYDYVGLSAEKLAAYF
jgi:1-deoxy-D-xylulose-5-phosphate synthase